MQAASQRKIKNSKPNDMIATSLENPIDPSSFTCTGTELSCPPLTCLVVDVPQEKVNMNVVCVAVSEKNSHDLLCSSTAQCQPGETFSFPKDITNRSCQAKWFKDNLWLHYDATKDSLICWPCLQAVRNKTITLPKEKAFLTSGMRNWKKATEKIICHARSEIHQKAITALKVMGKRDIATLLNTQMVQSQKVAYKALVCIFKAVRFLASQNIALQGREHDLGNFNGLVMEFAIQDSDEVCQWLKRRDNYLSDTIQNEIIEMFAHNVLRQIVNEVNDSLFIGIMCDGTTDCTGLEQESISVRFATKELESKEVFLGFYNPPDTTSDTLTLVIEDVFVRLNISLKEKLHGCSFDGAANMSGRVSGVQVRLRAKYPSCFYVHCANHSLDLVLQEAAAEISLIGEALNFVNQCANLIKESPKRRSLFNEICGEDAVVMQAVCPTRWCVRCSALSRGDKNYAALQEFLRELSLDKSQSLSTRATASGLLKSSMKGKTLLGIKVGSLLFGLCEIVAKGLQRPTATIGGCIHAINNLKTSLLKERSENVFEVGA
jgi:hypothetical protein